MAAGRPLQFDPDQALETAMRLFWQRGYEATSLQDLLQAMGLSKSSFYQAFGNKNDLYLRCISHYREQTLLNLRQALEGPEQAWDVLSNLFHCTIDDAFGKEYHWGCMVMNAATEFAQREASVATVVSSSTQALIDAFTAVICAAQKEGDIPAGRDAVQLAHYLLSSLSGLHAMLKAGTTRQAAESVVAVTLSALKSGPSVN